MGFADTTMLTSTVMVRYKWDTTDAKAKVKEMAGLEKTYQQALVDTMEQQNKRTENLAKNLAKVAGVVMLVGKGIGFAADAWKAYEKSALAAGGADAEKAKKFRAALDAMDASLNKIMVSVGGLVAELAPLVQIAAGLVDVIAAGIGLLNKGAGAIRDALPGGDTDLLPYAAGGSAGFSSEVLNDLQRIQRRRAQVNDYVYKPSGENPWDVRRRQDAEQKRKREEAARAGFNLGAAEAPGYTPGYGDLSEYGRDQVIQRRLAQKQWELDTQRQMDMISRGVAGGGGENDFARNIRMSGALGFDPEGFMRDLTAQRKGSIFESVFGAPEEIDVYREKLDGLQGVLSSFTDAALQSFEAWKDGSMTAVEAVKALPRAMLSSMATMAAQKALWHVAEMVESVIPGVFFNPAAAAGHAKVAAIWGGVAVGAGAAARALGGSGGAGASAPTVGGGAAAAAGGGGSSVTVVLDSSHEESPRMRTRRFARAISRARQHDGEDGLVLG